MRDLAEKPFVNLMINALLLISSLGLTYTLFLYLPVFMLDLTQANKGDARLAYWVIPSIVAALYLIITQTVAYFWFTKTRFIIAAMIFSLISLFLAVFEYFITIASIYG